MEERNLYLRGSLLGQKELSTLDNSPFIQVMIGHMVRDCDPLIKMITCRKNWRLQKRGSPSRERAEGNCMPEKRMSILGTLD